MSNKLLILYKTSLLNNDIHKLTLSYCNKYENVNSYFLYCDETIEQDILVEDNIIKIKLKEDNWQSLLIKVIKSFELFKNTDYTHVMVANISTIVNIPIIYKRLSSSKCISVIGDYCFNNINYHFPSGAGYIFTIGLVNDICKFFNKNGFLINNRLTSDFLNNYPSTDDIFFGYYLKMNNINIELINRIEIADPSFCTIEPSVLSDVSHFRIKTKNPTLDSQYFALIIKNIYNVN